MNHTENYQLNQWDAADPIRREDFNADNAALDAALNAIKNAAEEDVRSLNETVAALADTVEGHKIAVGSYTGNNGTQTISVGFKPKIVFIHNAYCSANDSYRSGLAITGASFLANASLLGLIEITDNGFRVVHDSNCSMNYSIYKYYYFAIC
ncbi:MAG: hypothetical protein ACI4O5_07195 [Oscillospiraceae bacterium]